MQGIRQGGKRVKKKVGYVMKEQDKEPRQAGYLTRATIYLLGDKSSRGKHIM